MTAVDVWLVAGWLIVVMFGVSLIFSGINVAARVASWLKKMKR